MSTVSKEEMLNAIAQDYVDRYDWHGTFLLLKNALPVGDSKIKYLNRAIVATEPKTPLGELIEKNTFEAVLRSFLVAAKGQQSSCPEAARDELVKLLTRIT